MKISFKSALLSVLSWALRARGRRGVFGLISCLLIASVGQASTSLYQGSFERGHGDWTAIRGLATADSRVLHGKSGSLRIERDAVSQDARVGLKPLTLVLGKRYESSGWVRTEALQVRDLGVLDGVDANFTELERPVTTGSTGVFANASHVFFISGAIVNNGGGFDGQVYGELCGLGAGNW